MNDFNKKDNVKSMILKNIGIDEVKHSIDNLKKIGINIPLNEMVEELLKIINNPKEMRNILRNK